ncbi:MAG TPA: nucleoside hydrolase [Catalimonadaceae bacterium]|nr:nucleoside hydrolase [Catalimonadaceae bacterium]
MKHIWLDCDPGHDDAMALILACYHPDSRLLGVTTVAGNQSVDKTFRNAKAVLTAIGCGHVPVFKGQSSAILKAMPFCAEIHGESGLDGRDGKPLFPLLPDEEPEGFWLLNWKESLDKVWLKTGEKIDLVAIGSLTNVALLLTLFPEVKSWIRITIMGGTMGIGNTGPVAEFNIENDPEAAHIVFESGVELTMVPLEVTHTALATAEVLVAIGDGSPFRRKIQEMLLFFRDTYRNVFGFDDPPLHDPLAVLFVLHPELFQCRKMRVDIERASELSRGQTVCDFYGRSSREANCNVALSVDVDRFWQSMLEAVDKADSAFREL